MLKLWPYIANVLTTFSLFCIRYVIVNYYSHKLLHTFQGKKMTQKILLLLNCTGFYSVLVPQLWPYIANTLTTFSLFSIRYVNIYYYNHKLLYTLLTIKRQVLLNCTGFYSVLVPQLWPYRANSLTTLFLLIIRYVIVNYYKRKLLYKSASFQGTKITKKKQVLLLYCSGVTTLALHSKRLKTLFLLIIRYVIVNNYKRNYLY